VIPGRELVRLLADPNSGLAVTPLIDADDQIGDASIDIRLGPDIIVSRRATGTTAFDPSNGDAFRDGLQRHQQYVRRGIGDPFHLQPGEFVIARSLEYVSLPDDISAEALGRSSWGRLGLVIATATLIQPGFKGTITLELANVGDTPLVLAVGLCIAQLVFSRDGVSHHNPEDDAQQEGRVTAHQARVQRAEQWWDGHKDRRPRSRYSLQLKPALSRLDADKDLIWVAPTAIRYIVGVVGERFAGKSTVSGFLVSRRQFRVYRLSQFVYEEARRRGVDVENTSELRQLGDDIRKEYGLDAIARMAFTRIRSDYLDAARRRRPAAILLEGFKVPEELEAFQKLGLFRTLLVQADAEHRLLRAKRSGEFAPAMAEDPLPDTPAGRLDWLHRHVDEPPDVLHPAAPLVAQARKDDGHIEATNSAGLPALYDVLRQETVPSLERWWRERDA
jgi:dCTP deaminase